MKDKVISYEAFSEKTKDPQYRKKIAGFTGVSLSHVEQGVSSGNIPLYQKDVTDQPHINCLLAPDMYKRLFDEESGIGFREARTTTESYGNEWALRELLVEKGYGAVTGENEQFDYIYYDILSPNSPFNDMDEDNPWETHDAEKITELFGSQANLDDILGEIFKREGVQVIYEKEHFGNFLERQNLPLRPDDRYVDDGAIELFEPIPEDAILAIVPLGQHEQQMFGE